MDTTNYNPTAAMPLDEVSSPNNKPLKTGANALAGGAIGAIVPHIIGKVKDSIVTEELESTSDNVSEKDITISTPVWAADTIAVATNVDDSMSFNEAFAAARNEVGAGGAFEWRGNVYGTYYAEEWNSMSPEAKADYNNHFSWNNIDTSAQSTSHHQSVSDDNREVVSVDNIEVVSVDHPSTTPVSEIEVVSAEPEIEVLGVVHDMHTGSNLGGLSVDGQEVFLIDVDGDLEFDIMASDLNHNNIVDEDEVVDIHGQGMTVNHLGGISEISENLGGEDELPDYMADNTYEI